MKDVTVTLRTEYVVDSDGLWCIVYQRQNGDDIELTRLLASGVN